MCRTLRMHSVVIRRTCGLFLVAVAVAVALHTVIEPLYHLSSEIQPYSPLWNILDPLMVAAVGLGVIFAYLRKRVVDRQRDEAAVTRQWLVANIMFYGLLFVAILLLWNWFNLLSPRFTAIGDETVSGLRGSRTMLRWRQPSSFVVFSLR